jgi:hypothetical protein
MPSLTDKQLSYYHAYLAELMAKMRMSDWDISISSELASPDSQAEIGVIKGQRRATIYLSAMFPYEPAESQRHGMTHELIHALVREMPDSICIAKDTLGKPMFDMLKKAHQTAEENVTDMLATVMAPFLPLPNPPWLKNVKIIGKS